MQRLPIIDIDIEGEILKQLRILAYQHDNGMTHGIKNYYYLLA
jgi:hypothetical protein